MVEGARDGLVVIAIPDVSEAILVGGAVAEPVVVAAIRLGGLRPVLFGRDDEARWGVIALDSIVLAPPPPLLGHRRRNAVVVVAVIMRRRA